MAREVAELRELDEDVDEAAGERYAVSAEPLLHKGLLFLPSDPPRDGRFVSYEGSYGLDAASAGEAATVEVVLARGASVRRRSVAADFLTIAEALPVLLAADPSVCSPAVAAWKAALSAGLGVLARGKLVPAVTPAGWDCWRASPLDHGDTRLIYALAAAMPPAGHCIAAPGVSPLTVASPEHLIRCLWDALADALVRTPAASLIAGADIFAGAGVYEAGGHASWLAEAGRGLEAGARVGLRIEMAGMASAREDGVADGAGDGWGGSEEPPAAEAVLQLTSLADPSLVVDAADLFAAPAAVLARLGDEAETDLLLALRRGARVWPALAGFLDQRAPSALSLDDGSLEDLLGGGADALLSAGIELYWPAGLLSDGLSLRLSVATASPPKTEGAGFSLKEVLRFQWKVALAGEELTDEEMAQLADAKRSIVRIRGRWVAVDPGLLAKLRDRRKLRDRSVAAVEALGMLLEGSAEVDGDLVEVVAEGAVADLVERLRSVSRRSVKLGRAPGLEGELRPYQERGVAWLHQMCELGLGGCLADDMGLGKTVQVIALHLHRVAGTRDGGPTLVVCPTSLLGNWVREVNRFAPGTPVRRYHGPDRTLEGIVPGEITVTSYGIARRDREALAKAGFSLIVADEAQHAKNPLSDTARALRAIGGGVRIACTGTPVENRLTELWSIIDWTTPGLLGPMEHFRKTVAVPIEARRDPDVTERLHRTVRPFLLRRTKTDPEIAPELPERIVTDHFVGLTSEQATLYEAEVREALDAIAEKTGIARQGLVFRMLTVLKQICNHPAQYLGEKQSLAGRSGKLAALEELLDVIVAEGESVLVFSQYVTMGALIEARLAELGIGTLFLHGGVPVKRREEMVAHFQAGRAPVFLLSLKAGGVGLNMTQATHVIHYDRWWNPAVEDQATDRAHRIGQTRSVQVHRLVVEGTLEDRIAALLGRKRELAGAVVGDQEAWISKMSDGDLADLVRLGSPDAGSDRRSSRKGKVSSLRGGKL